MEEELSELNALRRFDDENGEKKESESLKGALVENLEDESTRAKTKRDTWGGELEFVLFVRRIHGRYWKYMAISLLLLQEWWW